VVTDIVFRRLGAPDPRARRLLGAGGFRSPRLAPADDWCGLWNLTANDGSALVAVAATARPSPRFLEVRALAASGDALWRRLIRELTDTCRAQGAEWLVAAAAVTDQAARDLLTGFTPAADLDLPRSPSIVWLVREV
jgi:hypothetical protein